MYTPTKCGVDKQLFRAETPRECVQDCTKSMCTTETFQSIEREREKDNTNEKRWCPKQLLLYSVRRGAMMLTIIEP